MNANVLTSVCTLNFPLTRGELVGFTLTFAMAALLMAGAFALICYGIKTLKD